MLEVTRQLVRFGILGPLQRYSLWTTASDMGKSSEAGIGWGFGCVRRPHMGTVELGVLQLMSGRGLHRCSVSTEKELGLDRDPVPISFSDWLAVPTL